MYVYIVTTINTHKKKIIGVKNAQKLLKIFVCVCVCLYYTANGIIYKKNCNHDQFTKNVLPKFEIIPEPNTVKLVYG